MAASERTAEQTIATDIPRGTVGGCTVDDKPALFELYRAVYPNASTEDLIRDIRDEDAPSWGTWRDEQGEIRVAMFVRADGFAWLFVRPEDCESAEIRRGVVRLAEHVHRALRPSGVIQLAIVHGSRIGQLTESLAREGLLGAVFSVMRVMHFEEGGKVARTN